MIQIVQLDSKTLNEIGEDMLAAWQKNHGAKNGQAHAINGANCIVVFFEDAFTQAELHLAEQDAGQDDTLNRYVTCLLEHICQEQKAGLEERIGTKIVSTSVSADPVAGWAMCLFKVSRMAETAVF